ncbi:Predicted lipoprotein [Lishizhenia tianjinensis]|uniref:Predicted lipoprotein n=1 Tax=Lishizhenia tianjinensis TaxID=477690 RepID=A0A1I7AFT9_9FLAO|nr:imelysin family protein [Lishizhenia tianjinensis]SFT73730.1 Predicted lipoprotein [Lishizhenia tianjinensis]
MKRFKLVFVSALALSLLSSKCKEPVEPTVEFNKTALLADYADKVIVPSLTDLQGEISTLKSSFSSFQADVTQANLEALQNAWKTAYLQFQHSQIFNFGPSMDYGIKGAFGTYPCDTAKVDNNITSGSYTLGAAGNADAIGFPAMDYLLFDLSTQEALNRLASDANRLTYLGELIDKMQIEINAVVNAWNTSYTQEFKANTGTSSTSSMSFLVNEFNKDYELTKVAKFGIPIGQQSLGIPQPEYIEAPYSGFSFDLIKASLEASREVYKGDYKGNDGIGFQDYVLSFVDQGQTLNTDITSTYTSVLNKFETFNTTLKAEINAENTELSAAYDLIQSQVVNIKTDMPALFAIMITYQDNDGD